MRTAIVYAALFFVLLMLCAKGLESYLDEAKEKRVKEKQLRDRTFKVWIDYKDGRFLGYRMADRLSIDSNGCMQVRIKSYCCNKEGDIRDTDSTVWLPPYCEPFLVDLDDSYKPAVVIHIDSLKRGLKN